MNKVTVNKNTLVAVLTENRAEHEGKFLEAQQVYKRRVIEELEKSLERARQGVKVSHYFISLPIPENHLDDYDTVLQMLAMEVDDVVEITQQEFKCFVQNQWGWVQSFAANSLSYLASGGTLE